MDSELRTRASSVLVPGPYSTPATPTHQKKRKKEKGNMNKCISGYNFLTRMLDITLSTSTVKEHFNFNWMCTSQQWCSFRWHTFWTRNLQINILGLVLCSRLIMTGKNMYILGIRFRYPIKHVNLSSVRLERTKSFHMWQSVTKAYYQKQMTCSVIRLTSAFTATLSMLFLMTFFWSLYSLLLLFCSVSV